MNRFEVLAIVPARAGSKSVPLKNIAQVGNKPLIAYTIAAALGAEGVDRVIVSTNSHRIARIATSFGAEVPFLRPRRFAKDDTPGFLPIFHAIQWLEEHEGYRPDYVMCLQPTSPLRTSEDIESAIHLAKEKNADSVVSVTPAKHHPYWMKFVDSEGRASDFAPLVRPISRRQGLPLVYAVNGAIYLARRDVLIGRRTWYTECTYAYIMPEERSLDIDTPWDLNVADLVLRRRVS